MCTIDKMLIKGIRSFSPDNAIVVEFYTPLTLIVGHNGAGKTTIIECLKQACTGELPPNTRSGQNFIHDPKVAGETEVKAQIKLRFRTTGGQPVVIIRSFQLTQKKLQLQFKALDQILQTHNRETGQKEALSYRCADMDRIVPNLMGVSKAILENVIFVHQEDSNWPLSEGQVLKKKFDDIFAATKYTKALDAFRKLRLEKAQEVKEAKLKVEHLRTHKTNAHKLRAEIEQGKRREQELGAQIQTLEEQLQGHSEEMAELNSKIQDCQDAQGSLSTLKTRHEVAITRNAARQIQLINLYDDDGMDAHVKELEAWKQSLEPKVSEDAARINRLCYEMHASESKIEELRRQHASDLKNEAMLSAEAEAYKRNTAERDNSLRNASEKASMGQLPSGTLVPDTIRRFLDAFKEKIAAQESGLRELKSANQRQDDDNSALIDSVTAEITDASQKAKIKRQALVDNQARIGRLQAQVEANSVSQAMAQEAEQAEKAVQTRLKSKQDALEKQTFAADLSKIADKLDSLQRKTSALRQERDKLAVAADDGARMQLLRRERSQKHTAMETLITNRRQRMAALLSCSPDTLPGPDKLKAAFEESQSKRQEQLAKKGAELQKMQSQANTTQGALNACIAEHNQLRQEAEELNGRLNASLSQILGSVEKPLEECVHGAETAHSNEKAKLERIRAYEISINQYRRTAEQQNMCETCLRPFKGDEGPRFLEYQEQQSREIPSTKSRLAASIQATEGRLKALRALQPDWVRLEKLRGTVMAESDQKLKQLEIQAAGEAEAASTLHEEHQAAQEQIKEVQQLMMDVVWQVDRLAGEVNLAQREITRLEHQMKIAGSTRTVADVDSDLEALEAERGHHERSKDEILRKQGRFRDEISHLQSAWHAAREETMNARNAADKRVALEREIVGLHAVNVQLEHEAVESARSVEPLKAKREQFSRDRKQQRDAAHEREAEHEACLRELHQLLMQVQDRCQTVEAYNQAGGAERLLKVRRTLERTAKMQQEEDARFKGLTAELKEAENIQQDTEASKRQIEDLLDHKRSLAEELELKGNIDELQHAIGNVGDLLAINRRFTDLQKACTELRRSQAMAEGSLNTVREGMQRAQKSLGSVEFRAIDTRYRDQFVEQKIAEMAVSDLEKYHKAVEKALLAFHTNKMADINKIVKELWQKTYRNQDIDSIQIKADEEGTRSYNYRVVMQAGGAELDMRGRCSAGQKVLACLIIRLALAETFCLNCGILALDEPTTNLDMENSSSLAEALRNIMETRRGQDNFQLIVITHDENFAQMIGTREHTEHLWRITKDENQHSHIEREELLQ